MWIYNQIKYRDRRDPGILYYSSGNRVEFQVFPFSGNEVRTTGIEFIHKEPFTLNIDEKQVKAGNSRDNSQQKKIFNIINYADSCNY